MNTDFRISTTFWQHRKTVKLQRLLGRDGVWSLLKLWSWTAVNQPGGYLPMEAEDIEIAADWIGEPGKFVTAAVEIGWLDEAEGGFEVHDWQEHNEWASESQDRENKARFSRLYAKHAEEARQLSALGVDAVTVDEFKAIKRGGLAAFFALRPDIATTVERFENDSITTVERFENETISPAPAPALLPPLTPPRGDDAVEAPEPEQPPPAPAVPPCPQQDIIDLYHQTLPECPRVKVWPEAGRKQLAARWREDKARQHLDWWRRVFVEVAKSDFLMGRADGRSFTFSLTWFVKPTNFAKVLNGNYENRAPVERGGKQIGGLSF